MMQALIERLEEWLIQNAPEFYASLAPGASEQELRELEERLQITLPEDFKELYRWKNGHVEYPSGFYLWNGLLLPIESIASFWNRLPGHTAPEQITTPEQLQQELFWWNPKWVPFITYEDGDLLCVDMEGLCGIPGQIIRFAHESEDVRIIYHESIAKWLETTVALLDYPEFFNEQGIDDEADGLSEIRRQVNPGYVKGVALVDGHYEVEEFPFWW